MGIIEGRTIACTLRFARGGHDLVQTVRRDYSDYTCLGFAWAWG